MINTHARTRETHAHARTQKLRTYLSRSFLLTRMAFGHGGWLRANTCSKSWASNLKALQDREPTSSEPLTLSDQKILS